MNPLISIIVPVYNSEKYLDDCISSIVKQTYKNIEIIIVNDASTDSSLDIIESWAKKDDRIIVYDKKTNSGVSDSRNIGIEISKGEYIGFVDSDDFIDNDMYEFLLDLITKYDADIARCTFRFIYLDNDGEILDAEVDDVEKVYYGDDLRSEPLRKGTKPCITCNKLFKRNIIENVRYNTSIDQSEDLLFTYYATKNAKKMVSHDIAKYNYVKHNSERTDIDNCNLRSYPAFKDILENNKNTDESIYRCFVRIRMVLFELAQNKDNDNFAMVRKDVLNNESKILSSSYIKKDKKVLAKFYLLKYFPGIYKAAIRNK